MSKEKKYCIGCGILLQDENMTMEGYTASIENDICSRCFRMKNYGEYQTVTKSNEDYIKILKSVNKTNDLVLYIVDLLNLDRDIKYIRNSWIDFICEMDDILSFNFDIKYYNAHLGYIMTSRLDKNRQKYLNNTVEFLNDKKLNQKLNDKFLSIENTYSKKGDFSNVGNSADDFNYIFNKIENNNVYFCYDTGHDLINPSNYDKLYNKTRIIHFSDNDGLEDLHLGYKKGILDSKVFKKIQKINPDYLILEMNFNDIENTLKYF